MLKIDSIWKNRLFQNNRALTKAIQKGKENAGEQ